MKRFCLVLTFLVVVLHSFAQKKIAVLIVDGFSNHDWKQTTKVVKWILESTNRFTVDVSTVPSDTVAKKAWLPDFKKYKVVIQNTNNVDMFHIRWPKQAELKLEEYVKNGGGLFALHSANNAFPHWEEYSKMIGIGWRTRAQGIALEVDSTEHVVKIPVGEGRNTNHGNRFNAVIKILNRHPVNKGYPSEWKTAYTEVYNFPRGPAENINVLSYAYDSSSTRRLWPMEWVVKYGKGNVYSSSMGHLWRGETYPPAYRCIGFQTTLIRVTEWLATGKVKYAIPGNFPTKESISLADEAAFTKQ